MPLSDASDSQGRVSFSEMSSLKYPLEKSLAISVEKKVESGDWIWPGAGMDLWTHHYFHKKRFELLRKSAFGKVSDRQ